MRRFSTSVVLGSSILLATSAGLGAGVAAADTDKTVKPSKQQKAAIVKAWSKWDGGKAYQRDTPETGHRGLPTPAWAAVDLRLPR